MAADLSALSNEKSEASVLEILSLASGAPVPRAPSIDTEGAVGLVASEASEGAMGPAERMGIMADYWPILSAAFAIDFTDSIDVTPAS